MSAATEHLSGVCSSVFCCQIPLTDPSACAGILLLKYETRESLLLQLSAIRCLYNASEETGAKFADFSLRTTHFFTQNLPKLFILLIEYLKSRDQCVCYCASKALVSVLIHTGVKGWVITDIFTKLDTQVDTHVGTYCLQTIRETLKQLRKNIITTTVFKDQYLISSSECLHTIAHNEHWIKSLQLFNSKHFDTRKVDQNFQSTFAEFLSLTVELLRHHKKQECSAEVETTLISNLFKCIATSLLDILVLVDRFENIFIVKRFIDVTLKIVKETWSEEIVHFLVPAVTTLLGLQVSKKIVQCWIRETGKLVLKTSAIIENAFEFMEFELVRISVRKTLLLVIKCIASALSIHTSQVDSNKHTLPVLNVLCAVTTTLCQLLSSCATLDYSNTLLYTQILYEIVSEEDGCLVYALQTSNSIFRNTPQSSIIASVAGLNTLLAIIDPHNLWLCFLFHVNFDHSLLLDLLLSPEINFNTTLYDYLLVVASDWEKFEEMCSSVQSQKLVHSNQPKDWTTASYADDGSNHEAPPARKDCRPEKGSVKTKSEAHPLSMSTTMESTIKALVDYSSSSPSEDEDMTELNSSVDCVDVPTPLQADSSDKTKPPLSKCLDEEIPFSSTTSVLEATESQSSNKEDPCRSMTVPKFSPPSLSPSPLSPPDSLLSLVMDCMIQLRMCLERLAEAKLIQLTRTSCCELVTAIESIEKLYEDEET